MFTSEDLEILKKDWQRIGMYKGAMEIVNRLRGSVPNGILADAMDDFKKSNPLEAPMELTPFAANDRG